MAKEDIPLDPFWTKLVGEERKKERGKEREKEGRRRKYKEKLSTFSLDFPAIGPSVFVGAREKVLLRSESIK